MLDQQEGNRGSRVDGARQGLHRGQAGGRGQQRAEVLVLGDLQLLYRSVLSLGQEHHVQNAQRAAAFDSVNLRQQAALSISAETEGQRKQLQWCGHSCPPRAGLACCIPWCLRSTIRPVKTGCPDGGLRSRWSG